MALPHLVSRVGALLLMVFATSGLAGVSAQELAFANRGPRFLFAATPTASPRLLDVASVPVLESR